jgi:hypothetical protein
MPMGGMSQWTIEAPASLGFDDVTGLRVRLIGGSVAVLATDGEPSVEVSGANLPSLGGTRRRRLVALAVTLAPAQGRCP